MIIPKQHDLFTTTFTKKLKYWDMRYYWIRNHMMQEQFKFYWQRGVGNEAEHFTKHHATVYHRKMQHRYIRYKGQILELNITSQFKNETPFNFEGVLIMLVQRDPVINETYVKSMNCDCLAHMALTNKLSTFRRCFRITRCV